MEHLDISRSVAPAVFWGRKPGSVGGCGKWSNFGGAKGSKKGSPKRGKKVGFLGSDLDVKKQAFFGIATAESMRASENGVFCEMCDRRKGPLKNTFISKCCRGSFCSARVTQNPPPRPPGATPAPGRQKSRFPRPEPSPHKFLRRCARPIFAPHKMPPNVASATNPSHGASSILALPKIFSHPENYFSPPTKLF